MTPESLQHLAVLVPLSIAAGVDLYLTILFLGAAQRLGWDAAPPGGLADLGSTPILATALLFYVLELWIERRPLPALVWNAVHTAVRPVAGGLLALLALAPLGDDARWALPMAAGALTLAAHLTRSGWGLLMGMIATRPRARLLVSLAEDAGVLALLSLLLDAPLAAGLLGTFVLLMGLVGGRAAAGAFWFALAMVRAAGWALVEDGRWRGPERFPRWIRKALAEPGLAPGGGLRGSPAGAVNLGGLGLFFPGWVVVRGGSPLFLYRKGRRTRALDLGSARARAVVTSPFHTRVELTGPEERPGALYFSLDGPRMEDLQAEFMA